MNSKNIKKIIRKHGKDSDCQVVGKSNINENRVALFRGQEANGLWNWYLISRKEVHMPLHEQDDSMQKIWARCQAENQKCELVGQFDDRTLLY